MSLHFPVETFEQHGCSIVLRRVEGPEAREFFFTCRPPVGAAGPVQQTQAIYRAILDVLSSSGAGPGSVISENVFLRDAGADIESFRAARRQVLADHGAEIRFNPATVELEQAPLDDTCLVEVQLWAVQSASTEVTHEQITAPAACDCPECGELRGLRITDCGDTQFCASGIYGRGDGPYEQTLAMFHAAETLLQEAGMAFSDVMRTWIHFREMDRDYAEFNRARREFFQSRNIDPIPASTGIGAGLVPQAHDVCLGVYAVQSERGSTVRQVMTTPTLNEAPVYGSDFSRGMRVEEPNRVALFISGTASLDEAGRTVHVDDFDAQVDRMLFNVRALLEGQGAGFDDVVSAITYVKHARDAAPLQEKLLEAGYQGFPNSIVEAPVCRPELLCETELLALLPVGDAAD